MQHRLVELLCASGHGDQDAFAQLYDLTSARMYGTALRVLRSGDDAAEVIRELYLEVWRHAARRRAEDGSVLAWMTTMIHRLAVDRLRATAGVCARGDRRPRSTEPSVFEPVWGGVERSLDATRARPALAALTPPEREAVILISFGGYTGAQAAQLLRTASRHARAASGADRA